MAGNLSTNYFASVDITSVTTTRKSETLSGKVIRRAVGGQYWQMNVQTTALNRAEMAELNAFLNKQNGPFGSFTFVPPIIGSSRGTASGTPQVLETFPPGETSVKVNGATGTLKAGDFFKFSNHDKVYQLTADVDMDASTVDVLQFFPALTTEVTNTTTIQYSSVPWLVYLENDNTTMKISTDGRFLLEFVVREEI